jgi:hypothetical protein
MTSIENGFRDYKPNKNNPLRKASMWFIAE